MKNSQKVAVSHFLRVSFEALALASFVLSFAIMEVG
jgi:hypothetical protein